MSEFIEVRYVKARVQKDQAARHRHEEQPSTTHTPAPPPSVTATYSSTFDLLGRWLGEDHGTGFGDITDISSLTDSMAKITSSSPHTTYEQLDPLPSKRIREVNGSDDEDPDDHYGTSPKKQRYAERSPTPFLAPKSRSKAAGKVPQRHIASSTGTSRHMPGSYPKSVESAPRPSLRKTYAVSYNSSDHNLYPDLTQFMGSVCSDSTPGNRDPPVSSETVPTTSAPVLEPCVESTTLPVNSDARADPEPAKGNQLGVGQQDIQELGHHITRFTDALLAFTAQQSRFLDAQHTAAGDSPMDIDTEVRYDPQVAPQPEIPPPWAVFLHQEMVEIGGEIRGLGHNLTRLSEVLVTIMYAQHGIQRM